MMLTDSLSAVTVYADKGMTVSKSDTIQVMAGAAVSELLMRSPGLYVMDNGGAAGLKTVSFRGMGSAHTSIYIDGVRVGNMQSGQNDLGMIGIENCGSVLVDYARNSVDFKTQRPVFRHSGVAARVGFAAGSFGTYRPSARIDFRLSDKISMSADVATCQSKGDFRYADGQVRTNNDIRQIRSGLNLWGHMDRGDYHVKAYFNNTERGTPGSVYYPSLDRQHDLNAFVQGYLHKRFSRIYELRISAKGAYDNIDYTSTWGVSSYGQTEAQLNSSHNFNVNDWLRFSLAADIQWDALASTEYNASRLNVFTVLTSLLNLRGFSSKLYLEYNGVADRGCQMRNMLSPAFDIKVRLAEGLHVAAFARRTHRVPAFNELYYVGYGNPDLRTEKAWLTDVGVDYYKSLASCWSLAMKADMFCNLLRDKIVSSPSVEDPNIWRPYNIGRVLANGADLSAGIRYRSRWNLSLDMKYSYINAIDRTPESTEYGKHIPYIAGHSLACGADASLRGWEAGVIWQLRGGRYDSYGRLPGWNTLDVTACKSFGLCNAGIIAFKLVVRNILNESYEISTGYPMPYASVTAGVEYKF